MKQSDLAAISLRVSPQEALAQLRAIPNERARNAIAAQWRVAADGRIDQRSVCWLYCWAKTGMNSRNAAEISRRVFDAIFDVSYRSAETFIDHAWARQARYASEPVDDEMAARMERRTAVARSPHDSRESRSPT